MRSRSLAATHTNGARLTRKIASPGGYFLVIVVFLALILASAFYLSEQLLRNFSANPPINGLILGITSLGSLYLLFQVRSLWREIRWFNFAAHILNEPAQHSVTELARARKPKLLSPLDGIVRDSLDETKDFFLSASSYSAVVDGVANRIEERREVSRYLVGVLVFLGLLGTFWGLLNTIEGISGAIGNLGQGGESDELSFFSNLSERLKQPLEGMGVAFSSSLFGLAGSLILGFVELLAGQAHNRFLNDMEDALAELTHLVTEEQGPGAGYRSLGGEGGGLSEANATLDRLVKTIQRSEQSRLVMDANLEEFIRRLGDVQLDHAVVQRLAQQIAQLQELAYPVIVDTRTNLANLVNSAQMAELNQRLEYLASVVRQASSGDSPEFLQRLDRILAQMESGGGAGGGAGAEEIAEINKQLQALRQEMAAGRQSLGQQLMGLNEALRR